MKKDKDYQEHQAKIQQEKNKTKKKPSKEVEKLQSTVETTPPTDIPLEEDDRQERMAKELQEWEANLNDKEIAWWVDPLRIGGRSKLDPGTDFVTYYKHYMNGRTDAHELYKEACALFLISTMCKWNFILWYHDITDDQQRSDDDDEKKVEGIPLNLWFILLGKSRIARKTTCIKPVEKLVWKITEKKLITKKYGRKTRDKTVCARLPDLFTPEALISTLNDRCWDREGQSGYIGKYTHAAWINDEISGFFVKLAKQDYMGGTPEALSKIYDCPDRYFHETIGRGEEIVEKPYLTLLIASTFALPKLFTTHQLEQGFLNRPFYILDEKRQLGNRIYLPDSKDRWQRIEKWLTSLYNVKIDGKIFLMLMSTKYQKFEDDLYNTIMNKDLGLLEGYYSQLPELLQKLAALYCISRLGREDFEKMNDEEAPSGISPWNHRLILPEDYDRAFNFLKRCMINFKTVVKMATMKIHKVPIQTIDTLVQAVYQAIKDHFKETKQCPSTKDIYKRLHNKIKAGDLSTALYSLLTTDNIEKIEVQTATKTRIEYKPIKDLPLGGI